MKTKLEQDIVDYLEAHLKASRLKHVFGVVKMAETLAITHDVSLEKARLAALLHDLAKWMDDQTLLQAMQDYQIEDPYLTQVPHLSHGLVGAALAKTEFDIRDEEVLDAVRYHTFGRRGMSRLEKLIFLADYIEEGRSFDGVEWARSLAEKDLDEAVQFATEHTVRFLLDRGEIVHPNAIEMRNEWLESKRKLNG